jgi:transcriptional regulator with XRE-family HTH domain
MDESEPVEARARSRLRALRVAAGWSLDDLAARSNLSPSTISRIETGKRTMSVDVLVSLATALRVDAGSLLNDHEGRADVVLRPTPIKRPGATVWRLTPPTSRTTVAKMRLEPGQVPRRPKVHPGEGWFYVLTGRIRLNLEGRELFVEAGESASFSSLTSHAFDAVDGPAELIMVLDADVRHGHSEDELGD